MCVCVCGESARCVCVVFLSLVYEFHRCLETNGGEREREGGQLDEHPCASVSVCL